MTTQFETLEPKLAMSGVPMSVATPAAGLYAEGDALSYQVQFSEAVEVAGQPFVNLQIGNKVAPAVYVTGSGTNTLTFERVVGAGENDANGVALLPRIRVPQGASIVGVDDAPAALASSRALSRVVTTPNVRVDTNPATVTSVRPLTAGNFAAGEVMRFSVTFSEPVAVSGSPTLPIEIGGTVRDAAFVRATPNGRSLIFTVAPMPGDVDTDGVRIAGPIDVSSGATIRDRAGNDATLDASGSFRRVVVDAVAPGAPSFGTPVVNGRARTVTINVQFDEPMVVQGRAKPFIPFTFNGMQRNLAYRSGSGTNVLLFSYRLRAGESPRNAVVNVADPEVMVPAGASLKDRAGNTIRLNVAPTDIALSANVVPENTAVGTVVGILTATDADLNDSHTFEFIDGLGSTDNAAFLIVGNELRTNSSFDFETKSQYSVRVRATDTFGLFTDKQFGINVTNVNEFLVQARVVDGYIAGATVYADLDNDQERDWLDNNGDGAWNSGEGEPWALTDSTGFVEFDAGAPAAIRAFGGVDTSTGLPFPGELSAPAGYQVVTPLTSLVEEGSRRPGLSLAEVEALAKMAAELPAELDLRSYDPLALANRDTAAGLAYHKTNAAVANVMVAAEKLGIPSSAVSEAIVDAALAAVAAGTEVDLSDPTVLALILTDEAGVAAPTAVVATLASDNAAVFEADSFEAVTAIQLASQATQVTIPEISIPENTAPATSLFQAVSTGLVNPSYVLGGEDAASFNVDAAGAVRLVAPANFEAKALFTFHVVATDQQGGAIRSLVTLRVTDVNEFAPVFTSGAVGTVVENTPASVVIYQALVSDADGTSANQAVTFAIKQGLGDDAGLVQIDSATGAVRLLAPADFEAKQSYAFTVMATNTATPALFAERAVVIDVIDGNDLAPVFTSGAVGTVAENAPASVVIYQALVTDADGTPANQAVTFAIKQGLGDDAGLVQIDSATGAVRLLAPADFEAKQSYAFTVMATNTATPALFAERAVTVNVTDVNEFTPAFTSGMVGSVAENAPIASAIYTAAVTDADALAANREVTFSIKPGVGDAGMVSIDPTTGAVTLLANADFETKSSYDFTVVATNTAVPALFAERAVTVNVADVNEVPTDIALSVAMVLENAPVGTTVGTLMSTDPDAGDAHAYALVSGVGDTDNAAFQVVGDSLTTNAIFDHEAKSVYTVRVRSTDAAGLVLEKALAINVIDANDVAPVFTSGSTGSVPEFAPTATPVYVAAVTDGDGTDINKAVVFSIKPGVDDADFVQINPASGAVTLLASAQLLLKPTYSFTVVATNTATPALFVEQAVTVNVTPVNEFAPNFISGGTGTVAENAPIGTVIYTAMATDPDSVLENQDTEFSIKPDFGDAALVAIDPVTGEVTLLESANFEVKPAYEFIVVATNTAFPNHSSELAVTVNVTDVNDAPSDIALSVVEVLENAPGGTVVGTFSTTDPDAGDTFTYTLVSGDGATDNDAFEIFGDALQIVDPFDHESKSSYAVRVRATDANGLSVEKALTINVIDVNDLPPVIASGAVGTVAENAAIDTAIYTPIVTDADGTPVNQTVTFSIKPGLGDDAALVTIDPATGVVTLLAPADFETKASYVFTVVATNTAVPALAAEQAVTVTVTDNNEFLPVFTSGTTGTVPENAAIATPIYTAAVTDADALPANQSVTFSIKPGVDDAALVTIEPTTGEVTLLAPADFETKASYVFTVVATNTATPALATEHPVVVNVTNVNEAPTDIALSVVEVLENAPGGTVVGTFSTTDPDAGDTFTYTLVSGDGATDNDAFEIFGDALQIVDPFDHESKSSYAVRVRATDANGLSVEKALTINVTDLNEFAPVITSGAVSNVDENAPIDTAIYTATVTDGDGTELNRAVTFTIKPGVGDASMVTIDPASGEVTLLALANFETKSSYTFTVVATNSASPALFAEQAVTVTVNDVNDLAPEITSGAVGTVAENAPIGTAIYTATATDGDGTPGNRDVVFSIKPGVDDASMVTIDPASGVVTLLAPADFEAKPTVAFTVVATNTAAPALSTERAVVVPVTNVNEAPTDILLSSTSVLENAAAGTVVGTLSATDSDAGDTSTYLLVEGAGSVDNPSFQIVGNELRTTTPFDFETKNSYSVRVRTTDAGGLTTEKEFAITVTDANEFAPVFTSGPLGSVAENTPSGTVIYDANVADADGTPVNQAVTFSIKSGVGDANLVAINPATGVVTLLTSPDAETKSSYAFTVVATNTAAPSHFAELAVTVGVTSVNEAPTDILLSSTSVLENALGGTVVGTLSTTDPDAGDTFAYTLVSGLGDTDNDAFEIFGNALQIVDPFDFETQNSYTVRIRSTDAGGLVTEESFTISVTDIVGA